MGLQPKVVWQKAAQSAPCILICILLCHGCAMDCATGVPRAVPCDIYYTIHVEINGHVEVKCHADCCFLLRIQICASFN